MSEYKCPLDDRFVQVTVGDTKLINLQIVAWLQHNRYSHKNDGEFLYFDSEEILAHFIMVWGGSEDIKEYWGEAGVKEMLKNG